MLTKTNLEELLAYKSKSPILSVYLNTNPAKGTIEDYKLQLRSMLKGIDLPQDVEAVKEYFDLKHDWGKGRGVAVFSNQADDFFEAHPLAVDVRSRARFHHYPHIKPLAALFDTYSGSGVILIDQQQARFFSFQLGELKAEADFSGGDVKRQKHGGGSQIVGRSRGVEGIADSPDVISQRNMRDAAQEAAKFLKANDVRRLLLGGTDKNISLFREMLPKSWQSLIVGTFSMSMDSGHDKVRAKALEIEKEVEKKRQGKLVQTIITEAAKGRNGLTNPEDVLDAAREGRVQTLVIQDGYREKGYQCQDCGHMTLQKTAACPFCSGNYEEIEDAVEMAVRATLRADGSVKVLEDEQLLSEHGKMAALLRY
ncbi:MAG: hypothetical protein MAG431_00265 [Chloroflexi bacterium]|nr:hypothetical protein [Chloroflexota bacterium]